MCEKNGCDHDFVHLESIKTETPVSYSYVTEFKKVDRFYCRKCLEQRDIVHQQEINRSYKRFPDWW